MVVASTVLSEVDGERGTLIIAGTDVERLAVKARFEEVCERLWEPYLPGLGRARVWAHAQLAELGSALSLPDGMEALRASLARLPAAGCLSPTLGPAMQRTFSASSRARQTPQR